MNTEARGVIEQSVHMGTNEWIIVAVSCAIIAYFTLGKVLKYWKKD